MGNPSYYHWVFNEGTGIFDDVVDKAHVGRRDLFGVIVSLLPRLELLMYAKPISFLVGITNLYEILFYQVYLLTWITIITPIF